MSDGSKIEWTDATWNPTTGCTEVSPGCDLCYARTFAERWRGTPGHPYEQGFDLRLWPERLDQPLRWTKPRRVFVNSMSDLFHDGVDDRFIARVFAVMAHADRHTFQILTKRHGRLRSLLSAPEFYTAVAEEYVRHPAYEETLAGYVDPPTPIPNVWVGVSAEDQKRADLRIPALLDTPAAVRFVSAEPLLGPIDFREYRTPGTCDRCGGSGSVGVEGGGVQCPACSYTYADRMGPYVGLDWIIVGGESGPGARPLRTPWVHEILCEVAGEIPVFVKQMGKVWAKATPDATHPKGGDPEEWPGWLRVREFPAALASHPAG